MRQIQVRLRNLGAGPKRDALHSGAAGIRLAFFLGSLLACEDAREPTQPIAKENVSPSALTTAQVGLANGLLALRGDAAAQRQAAAQGRRLRGGQDDMLRIEAVAPGFAGYYVDENEELVLLQKSETVVDGARIRALMDDTYVNHTSGAVRALVAGVRTARILPARYSLSELVDYEQRFAAARRTIPGIVGWGTTTHRNLVEVVVATTSDIAATQAMAASLGIPADAFEVKSTGPALPLSTWSDVHRPTKAGIRVTIDDGRYDRPDTAVSFSQSHGFNARIMGQTGTPTAFLTSAHGPNAWGAQNGSLGFIIYQAYSFHTGIGSITTNPPWNTFCPSQEDYCMDADVALGTFASGVTGQRTVGTSNTQGNDGAVGSQSINGFYAISDVLPVDFIPVGRRNIFKSGFNTGTTAGTLGSTNFSIVSVLAWGDPYNPVFKSVGWYSHVRVDSIGWGRGDSGGPVFVHFYKSGVACNPYCAVGLSAFGLGTANASGVCTAGKQCQLGASTWANIEQRLNLGVLNPRTN